MQVKYAESDGAVLVVRCRSLSLTNGRVRATKRYTARDIDWLAVYDGTTEQCHYVPARLLGTGRSTLNLRLAPTRNGQTARVHLAADYRRLS